MSKKVFIRLDTPCLQNWEEMCATDKGRFCKNCKKTVIDFTGLSDAEIISNFNLSNNNTCGRFNKSQLERGIYISSQKQNSYTLPKVFASFILLPLLSGITKGKITTTSKTDSSYVVINKNEISETHNNIKKTNPGYSIYGKVQDSSLSQNLYGVSIVVKNKKYQAVSDRNGNFHIDLPERYAKTNFKILFSYFGYNTLNVKVQNKKETFNTSLNIFMHPATTDLNEVVVVGGAFLSE